MSYVIPVAGLSPLSFFVPLEHVDQPGPPPMLADAIDLRTGDFASISEAPHPVDAAVLEQFRLWRGTGVAVADQGQNFRSIEKVTDATPRELEDEARAILRPFVERGDVAILSITTESPVAGTTPDTGLVTIHYRNLMTGSLREVST